MTSAPAAARSPGGRVLLADSLLRARIRAFWLHSRRRRRVELQVLDAISRPGSVIVDAGAHEGYYTAYFARNIGARGQVHAFEPNVERAPQLERVARAYGNVTLYIEGLSDHVGTGRLYVPRYANTELSALASLGGSSSRCRALPVRVTRLDDLLDPAVRVSAIKCDVEGHELAALAGARQVLTRHHPTLLVEMEERHATGTVAATVTYLSDLGYDGFMLTADRLRRVSEFDLEQDQLRWIDDHTPGLEMPARYVNNFLFVADKPNILEGLDALLAK